MNKTILPAALLTAVTLFAQGPVLVTVPDQSSGPPFYMTTPLFASNGDARTIGQKLNYLPVIFLRQAYCVPADMDLWSPDLKPAPPFLNRADLCPSSVSGWELFLNSADLTSGNYPLAVKVSGDNSVLICFVPYADMLKTAAGKLTLAQLQSIPGIRWGHAYHFSMYWQFHANTNNINEQEFIADGITLDGSLFAFHLHSRFTPDVTGVGDYPAAELAFSRIGAQSAEHPSARGSATVSGGFLSGR